MDHRDVRARFGESMGGLEPEQPAADHDDACTRGLDDRLDVIDITEGEDARQIDAGNGGFDRAGARRKDELGEGKLRTIRQRNLARQRIDRGRAHAIAQRHAAVAPPSRRLEFDFGEADLLRQQSRQQHAIIGKPRFLPDHRNGVAAERARGQFLDETCRGHAVADDDQRLAHRFALKLAECAALRSTAPDSHVEQAGSPSPSMGTWRTPFQVACQPRQAINWLCFSWLEVCARSRRTDARTRCPCNARCA